MVFPLLPKIVFTLYKNLDIMLLNPATDNFIIEFNYKFYENEWTKTYDDYLFHLNGPIKDIKSHMHETIQEIEIPGLNLQTLDVGGIPNATKNNPLSNFPHTNINRMYPGTASMNDVVDTKVVNITFRNTVLNWAYIYQVLEGYYRRTRNISEFNISITVLDAALIPILIFTFKDCFASSMPGLSFGFNSSLRETKTIQAGFAFNGMDVRLSIPKFDMQTIKL